jgi:uncharacterized C2H2 Zn-finger protein
MGSFAGQPKDVEQFSFDHLPPRSFQPLAMYNPSFSNDTAWQVSPEHIHSRSGQPRMSNVDDFFADSGQMATTASQIGAPFMQHSYAQPSGEFLQEFYYSMNVHTRQRSPVQPSKRRQQPSNERQVPPVAKRRRVILAGDRLSEFDTNENNCGLEVSSVTDTHTSECCSSCTEGVPCTDPDCDVQKEAVVPCMEPECEQRACPDPCLSIAIQQGQTNFSQDFVPSSARLLSWDSTPWTSQSQRAAAVVSKNLYHNNIDPSIMSQIQDLQNKTNPDSVPTTPSMGNHIETPFSPTTALPTPRSMNTSQSIYTNDSDSMLYGAGMLFNPSGAEWGQQYSNDSSIGTDPLMQNCYWNGCSEMFPPQEWIEHLHREHVDPQMTFGCPVPSENCPPTMTSNPLHHLGEMHGYNLLGSEFRCPDLTCAPGAVFRTQGDFHQHLDLVHASPASGSLVCQWNSCGTEFTNQNQLLAHLNEHHPPAKLVTSDAEIGLADQSNMAPYSTMIPDLELEDETSSCRWKRGDGELKNEMNSCKWKTGDGDIVCGALFGNEAELHDHVKDAHLSTLNVKTGYVCQWESCNRPAKLAARAGFSQRQKLERHMATHTGCKFCPKSSI